tara:strand:- start:7520 stop:11149 length:3630 start_codon:yes stop_codon:yes gene_type:complete
MVTINNMKDVNKTAGWQFWVDRGGTFTDIVAKTPDGSILSTKLLSENKSFYKDAAVHGIVNIAPNKNKEVATIRMGTTVATNALLERRGSKTALVITEGFGDAIRIGYQSRPNIFSLNIDLPEMLYTQVIEASERVSAYGDVIRPLDQKKLRLDLEKARKNEIESVAIIFLHGYRFPEHEKAATKIAKEVGIKQISVSHLTSPLMKLISRGDTTLADAYLSPILNTYINQVKNGLQDHLKSSPLLFMQSHGGLTDAGSFRGKDSVLSGPAGGVVGMVGTASSAGLKQLIGFDMGGTSTDVSLYNGNFERTTRAIIAGVRLTAPMMQVQTVAAGGGSILKFSSNRLQVGPESAGANPGPACYRNRGPLTITDANVLLGRIQPDYFPKVFGPEGNLQINNKIVLKLFSKLSKKIQKEIGHHYSERELAEGFVRIAVERMSTAIKKISIQRGHDVTNFSLCCFGGAAGQHACQVADSLGVNSIFIHPMAGVLSAYGMGLAEMRSINQASIESPLEEGVFRCLERTFSKIEENSTEGFKKQGVPPDLIRFSRRLMIKLKGTDTALPVAYRKNLKDITTDFHSLHNKHFGFDVSNETLIVESIESEGIVQGSRADEPIWDSGEIDTKPDSKRGVWFNSKLINTPIYQRKKLAAGWKSLGPAIVVEPNSTTIIDPGWQATINRFGHLLLTRTDSRPATESLGIESDPIMLEIFNNLFMHIAEQMGIVLENTARSINIKERLDFSCALFDAVGDLIANAPHMPVHLGSMGESVRAVLTKHSGTLKAGNVYLLNAPYNGGTHLPDITVVTPVFNDSGTKLEFFVACRAHHADIGGKSPGSMPATSKSIKEEGILIDNQLLVSGGVFLENDIRKILSSGSYPARNPDQNIADLKAQVAANNKGVMELQNMTQRFGLEVVQAYMKHIKKNAEDCVRKAINRLNSGSWRIEMDNQEHINVSIQVNKEKGTAIVDFNGTSPQSSSNFNAPKSVVRAAVLYVFRTLVEENIPLNDGCLRPITIRIPEMNLLNPHYPAPVVAGNVETSQCITDALLAALGACAGSQGTMNNFTFGNENYQYYETICGGAGAGPDFNGASAVQTHMTNSRLTDTEVLESRYPIRIEKFEIKKGSGGRGTNNGGDGVRREILFLEPMQASILSNRRQIPPLGLANAENGKAGKNYIIRKSRNNTEKLSATAEVSVDSGDRFIIETPGGGGYGRAG